MNGRQGRLPRSAPQPCAVRYGAATRSMSAPAVACCRGGVQLSDICGRPVKSKTSSKDEALQCFRLMAQTTEGSSTLHCGGQNDGPGIVARGVAALRGMAKRPSQNFPGFPRVKGCSLLVVFTETATFGGSKRKLAWTPYLMLTPYLMFFSPLTGVSPTGASNLPHRRRSARWPQPQQPSHVDIGHLSQVDTPPLVFPYISDVQRVPLFIVTAMFNFFQWHARDFLSRVTKHCFGDLWGSM